MTHLKKQPNKKGIQAGGRNKIEPHRVAKVGFTGVLQNFKKPKAEVHHNRTEGGEKSPTITQLVKIHEEQNKPNRSDEEKCSCKIKCSMNAQHDTPEFRDFSEFKKKRIKW